MTVRPVVSKDIPLLAEFWYDQMALRSQKQKYLRLLPDAQDQWEIYAQTLLYDAFDVAFLLVELEGETLGCGIARIQNNEIGVSPSKIGVIENIILDMHSPHKRKNAVTELLTAIKEHFRKFQIDQIIVKVPTQSPVEGAFWRGLGWVQIENTFWMDLE